MTRTTMRWTMAGAMAAGMLAAAPGWRTAEAAPGSGNPFAGAYTGIGPITETLTILTDITGAGRVTGSSSWSAFGLTGKYKLTGTVTEGGAFSYRIDYSVTGHTPKGFTKSAASGAETRLADSSTTTTYGSATLVKNTDGSVTSTACTGTPIVWNLR